MNPDTSSFDLPRSTRRNPENRHRTPFRQLRHAAIACMLPATGVAAVSDGLTHQWNFDESRDWHDSPYAAASLPAAFYDSVGSLTATPTGLNNSAVISGREFMALSFPGSGSKLQVAQNLAPELGGTASLAFWMRGTATGGADYATSPGVVGTAAASGGIQWGWLDSSGRINFSADASLLAQSPQPVNDGIWHFIVITRNSATGAAQLYVDGNLADSRTGPTGVRNIAFQSLGRIENASGNAGCFVGGLDKLTVFNRVISAAEVTTFMNNHAPKTWNLTTEGVNDRAFGTDSVFKRAYDVERDPLTILSWTTPAHGAATHNGDGSFTYTATGGYTGTDAFDVTVSDGNGGYHRSTITVNSIDEPPGGVGVPITQFTNFAAVQANGADISHSGWRAPRAVDWNNDGKMDILVGAGGYVWRYMNTGTASAPVFAAAVKVQANGADVYAGSTGSCPITVIDMTGDGKPDLVISDSSNKLRVYPNTAAAGQAPVYGAHSIVKRADGTTDFTLPDRRFDIADWNGDGKPDLVTGTFSGNVQLYLNANTAASPRFETSSVLFGESYNAYPRLYDLNGNGAMDLVRGINWGNIRYWLEAASGLNGTQYLSITNNGGTTPDIKAVTDGAVVDFADFNGDGKYDLLIGGHAGDKIFLATGVLKTPAESLADIEAIYDAHPSDLGTALSANSDQLLGQVNAANNNIVTYVQKGTLSTREAAFAALTAHINKYPFLKYQQLDTAVYHHVPSIVLQNWVFLEYLLPSTPTRRAQIADTMGLTGTMREIYLETGMALGDNGQSLPATYTTIRDFQRRHPRELFPDALMTTDQLYGDNRGGFVWTPNSTKNTFGQWALGNANEWAGDLTTAIESVLGTGKASGDYFTFVMGHEVTHSLDNYVKTRANTDLRRRWGLTLTTASGPDVIAGANGWIDWTATQNNFIAKGYYNTATQTWRDGGANDAWALYWSTGPGSVFNGKSFMRGNIDWFLTSSQESLATQANHHWANGHGRIIGAVDRFRRGLETNNPPMKANINEVVTFIDFISAGMNRVNLVETKNPTGSNVVWTDHYADLVRDDNGRITRISVDGKTYNLTVNVDGVVTDVDTSVVVAKPDIALAVTGQGQSINVLANDYALEGGAITVTSFTQPAHGSVTTGGNGILIYQSAPGYTGADNFTYTAGGQTVAVTVTVMANTTGILLETWLNLSGNAVSNLTGSSRYPNSPDQVTTIPTFESATNRADNYGARARGYVTAPATGSYTFWIASDDGSELWLSTDANPANKVLIASVSNWTGSRAWTTYPSQQSTAVNLTAGQRYYIEALHKEGGGGDNLAVAWQGPGITQQVIGSAYLKAFGLNNNPTAGADSSSMNVNTTTSIAVLANDADSNGDTLQIQSIVQPSHGSAAVDGNNIVYTPAADYSGSDSFTYTVSDGNGGSATALVTLTVNKLTQTITFGSLAAVTYGGAPFPLTASASSGLAVSYSSSNTSVATIAGDVVTIVGAGSTTITASQSGNAIYSAAATVPRTLIVNQAAQTISFGPLPGKLLGDAPFALTATANSGLTVGYNSSNTSVATISGNTVTIVGTGTTTITASQPGDTNFSAASDVSQALVVNVAFGNGVWTNTAGGSWPASANWQGGTIADGIGSTASFAALDLTSDTTVTLDGSRTLGGLVFGDTSPSHNWLLNTGTGGPLTLDVAAGSPAITVNNQTATIGAIIAGADGLTKSGAGTLVLSGAGTWTGTTAVNSGILEVLAKSGNVTYTVAQGATLKLGYSTGGGYTPGITIDGNGVADPAGVYIKGGVNFQTNGGLLIQTAPTTIRSYGSGNATIQGFDVNSAFFVKTVAASSGSVIDSTVNLATGSYGYKVLTDPGTATTTGDLTILGVISGSGSAAVGGEAIATGFDKRGNGSVRLTGASTFSGGTSINAGSIIVAGGANRLPASTTVALGNGTASGRLVLEGVNQTIGDLLTNGSGTTNRIVGGSATESILTVNYGGLARTFTGILGGAGTNENNLAFTKTGTGTLVLSGANTHTGATSINGGTLLVTGSLANTATTVSAAGTLGGTGTIGGAVTNNGTLAPGNSSVGSLTVNNPLTLAAASSLAWEINNWTGTAGTAWDRLVSNTLNITATSANPVTIRPVDVSLLNFSETSASFVIAETTSGITGFSPDKFIVDVAGLTLPQGTWSVQQAGNNLRLVYTRFNTTPAFAADPITASATEDSPFGGTLIATDPDIGETLSFTKDSGPAWLSVASNGNVSGTPSNGDVGVNTFSVRVTDSMGAVDTATLQVTVANVNDAPVFNADPVNLNATEDAVFTGQLNATDIDAGETLTFSKVSGPSWLTVSPSGALSGTPANGDVGANSFTVRVTDVSGSYDEAALNITVANVNDAPVFTADPINLAATEDSAFTAQLAATDVDAGETLTFTKVSGPAWLSVSSAGALSGTPANSNVGANAFTVRLTDSSGASDDAVLNITVTNVNDAPTFTVDPILKADASEGTAYTGQSLAGSATDVDAGDTITYSKVSGPAWLGVAANGALTGTPPSGSSGLNTFIVRATDGSSATDDAELRITVTGLPLPWTNGDIGTGMLAGSATYSTGTFTEAGSGAMGGTSDRLNFTYQTLTGDGEITARVSSLENTGTSSRVGVMIRDTLATNSRMVFMGLTGSNAYRWARRTSTGGSVSTSNSSTGTVPNTWLRLTRAGNVITAYKSSNGTSWTTVGSTTVTLAANCYIGLTVSSGSTTTLNTSQFSNVSVTP